MQVSTKYTDDTNVSLTITGDAAHLAKIKQHVLQDLAKQRGNVPGFRKGKAPAALLEKQLDPNLIQAEVLEHAVNDLFIKAVSEEKLRTVSRPEVEVTKFVPYDTLEFVAKVEVIGKVKLPDYKKIKASRGVATITDDEVEDVVDRLRIRDAEKVDVDRAAKDGDQVWIDFSGVDTKTKEAVAGADGKDYPLGLGSNTFIPDFEPQLVGLKAGDEKTFDITFPKDYGVQALQNKAVTFTVKVNKVQEVVKPELNKDFLSKIGPFETAEELKTDIRAQLQADREQQLEREYENELVTKISEKTEVAIPKSMIDEQIDRMEQEERQNLLYRGQTWEEHLKDEGVTAEEHRERNREQAELRVKAGLVLSEIAEQESIEVAPEEFDAQLEQLRRQYPDTQMQAELAKPENQRDIVSRILTQKTLSLLKEHNQPVEKKPAEKAAKSKSKG